MDAEALNPCPACGARAGELKTIDARLPYSVTCAKCGFSTPHVRLPGVAIDVWNKSKSASKKAKRER